MIVFNTQEEFESAVMCVIVEKLGITVYTRGHPFLTSVTVGLKNNDDAYNVITDATDGCY